MRILEKKHEQSNSTETKPLVPRRKCLLQLILINKPTSISINHFKAPYHIWVGPRRKRGVPICRKLPVTRHGVRLLLRRRRRRRRLGIIALSRRWVIVRGVVVGLRQRRRRGRVGLRWRVGSAVIWHSMMMMMIMICDLVPDFFNNLLTKIKTSTLWAEQNKITNVRSERDFWKSWRNVKAEIRSYLIYFFSNYIGWRRWLVVFKM